LTVEAQSLAASIAGGQPIDLFDDTTSLDDVQRGWAFTTIGHRLSRGGAVAFDAAARTWLQMIKQPVP